MNVHLVEKPGLVAQSVMSATDMLGHWDEHGMFVTDPRPRQWISALHYAQGCWHAIKAGVGNRPPHVCAQG